MCLDELDDIGAKLGVQRSLAEQLILIESFLRRVEYRGSDVRLDINTLHRPLSWPRMSIDPKRWVWAVGHSYAFHHEGHINQLEMHAYLQSLQWRLRSQRNQGQRFLHLLDSQVSLAVCTKGRSSSHRLNRICRRISALLLCGDLYPLLAWVGTEDNPADEASRKHAPKSHNTGETY